MSGQRVLASSLLIGLALIEPAALGQRSTPALADIPTEDGRRYSLFAGTCDKNGCSVSIELRKDGRTLDRYQLDPKTSFAEFTKVEPEPEDGIGDPLGQKGSFLILRSGDDEDAATISVRAFQLSPQLTGILIDQRAGFERLKRWHTLLGTKDNKLQKLWDGSEGEGLTFSTTVRLEGPDHSDVLIFYRVFYGAVEDVADKLRIEALAYDSKTGKMMPSEVDLNTLTIGPYRTVSAGRAARIRFASCKVPLLVLPAADLSGSRQGGYLLASISSDPSLAEWARIRLASCVSTARVSASHLRREALSIW